MIQTANTNTYTAEKVYPAGVFFMRLKMNIWIQGHVEGVGLVSLLKEYPSQKALYSQYMEMISASLQISTDIYLSSLKVSCKNNVWDLSSVAIAIFRIISPIGEEPKDIAVKVTRSEKIPFIKFFKKYSPKDIHPVIEMEDKTVNYNGKSHSISINPPLPLQYLCVETRQSTMNPPIDAGEYIVSPVGKNDIGAKLTIKKIKQTILFNAISDKTYGDADFNMTACSDSGLDVRFETSDTDVVEINGNNIKILKAGEVVINACQTGNRNFLPETISTLFEIKKAEQQILFFTEINNRYIKDPAFELSAVSSSGLTVEFETPDTKYISIERNTVTLKKAGTVTIIAVQKGDDRYESSNTISHTFTIEKGFLAWIRKIFRK